MRRVLSLQAGRALLSMLPRVPVRIATLSAEPSATLRMPSHDGPFGSTLLTHGRVQ